MRLSRTLSIMFFICSVTLFLLCMYQAFGA
jgi:hypothetical protein